MTGNTAPDKATAAPPTVVKVFGVLITAYNALGLCCSPVIVLLFQIPEFAKEYPEGYEKFVFIVVLVSLALVIYGAVAGIGLLMNKPWARFHAVLSATLYISYTVLYIAVDIALFGYQWRLEQEGGAIGAAMEGFTYLTLFGFYGLTIFFLSRPNVKEHFGR